MSRLDELLFASMAGTWVAGQFDLACSCFGWGNPATGQVYNSQSDPSWQLGFVMPQIGNWGRVYHQNGRRYIRSGFPVTLASRGEFWARFMSGANFGDPVYANPIDGSLFSGMTVGAQPTPWFVSTYAPPGALAVISSWRAFT